MSCHRADPTNHARHLRHSILSLLIIPTLLLSGVPSAAFSPPPIFVAPMEYYVDVISGNLTADFMKSWPRVIFVNSTSSLSPSFDLGILSIRFYNSSVADGVENLRIDHPELIAPTDLLSWNLSIDELDYSANKGEYVIVRSSAVLNLFDPQVLTSSDEEYLQPVIEDWGMIELEFEISQLDGFQTNLHPSKALLPNHRISISVTILIYEVDKFYALAIEENFQAGGRTKMARIYPSTMSGTTFVEEVSTWENELSDSTDIAHEIPPGMGDWQLISLSTATGAEQALCAWNRSIMVNRGGDQLTNYSYWFYRTTGTSVSLLSLSYLEEDTKSLEIQQTLSLIDEGFDQPLTNILLDFLPFLIGLSVLIPSILLAYRFARIRRASRITSQIWDENSSESEIKPK